MNKHIIMELPDAMVHGLKINYSMEHQGDYHTIECTVDQEQAKPSWLQLYKFNFVSLKIKGYYNLLFEPSKYDKNLQTLLFMDQVYVLIMSRAKYKIA